MKLFNYINPEELREMIDLGYIDIKQHPSERLYIYNYTKKCQFEKIYSCQTIP